VIVTEFIALLLLGTIAGIDLVSGPQILLARPIVVGTLTGLILGDPASGILAGGILELYAQEVLPVGATRYPDYGPGTVAAVWLTNQLGTSSVGFGVLTALIIAELGGWSLHLLRRANGRALELANAGLVAGDVRAAAGLQVGGIVRDGVRSLVLTAAGLLIARLLFPLALQQTGAGEVLGAVMIATGLAGAVAGAIRTSGRGWRGVVLAAALLIGWVVAGSIGSFPRAWEW
jgi:mannose/fructose/N-acetylgalactosamine-specific phosphotransferase system component IIC